MMISIQGRNHLLWIQELLKKSDLVKKLRSVELLVCDIDGSLTSGHLVCSDAGIESKLFSVIDGLGMTTWQDCGNLLAIISKRNSIATQKRTESLGIPQELCLLGVKDKRISLQEVLAITKTSPEKVLVWGDDIPDFELKEKGVLIACPAQSPFYLQAHADFVLPCDGGNHALRLLTDFVLYVQGKHPYQESIHGLCS